MIYRTDDDLIEHPVYGEVRHLDDRTTIHKHLTVLANYLYGVGQWAMVNDTTVVGFHVGTPSGETLHYQ